MKTCADCGVPKPLIQFRKNPNGRYGVATYCRPCQSERSRLHHRKNRARNLLLHRAAYLRRCYGLDVAEYDRMVTAQDGRCAICQKVPRGRLHIDHDHASGALRGLLCARCNRLLGQVERFGAERLLAYLRGEA